MQYVTNKSIPWYLPSKNSHSLRRFRYLALTVVVAATAAVIFAAPVFAAPTPAGEAAAGGIGLRLLDAPVSAGADPRARVYIIDHLAPGTTIHRRLAVSNTTTSTAKVTLYAAAATISKGSFVGSSGHSANDLSTWTSVTPATPDIPAGAEAISTVTIAVPRNAAPGEQYGVVWAEIRSAPADGKGVVQVSRVGIRLYLSIGPGGAPASDFTINSLTAERATDGSALVLATVHNTGGRALDMNGTLTLSKGPGGLSAGPFSATLGTTLAIGDTEPVKITLDKRLPAGPWAAVITLRSGLLQRSAKATITFPASGVAAATLARSNASSDTWVYLVIAAGVLLLVLIAAFFIRRRKLSSAGHRPPDRPADELVNS